MAGSQDLLEQLKSYTSFLNTLDNINESRWTASLGEGKWSIRDIVSHIMMWDKNFLETITPRLLKGEPVILEEDGDVEGFNQRAMDYGRTLTQTQLLEEAKARRKEIVDQLERFSPETFIRTFSGGGEGHTLESFLTFFFISHDAHHRHQVEVFLNSGSGYSLPTHHDSVSLEAYQGMAEYYFTEVDHKPFNAYYERPATLSLLPDVTGKDVLDAGCAAGWYTHWLLEKGARVTALDFSPNMVGMTKRRVGDRARVIRADLNEPLDFITDQSIDLVVSSLTLHYLKHWDAVMSEFYRILRKGGTLVFSVHHPFMDYTVFQRKDYFATELLEDEWETPGGNIKVNFYRRPLSQVVGPVIEAGFDIEKLTEPMPTEDFKSAQPLAYERLMLKPQFLFIRAIKAGF